MILRNIFRSCIVTTALLTAACSSNKITNDIEDANLVGPIKSITERQYIAVQDFENVRRGDPYRPDENDWDIKINFNKDGYIVEQTQLSIGGDDTVTCTSLVYDSIKTNLKVLEITDNENGEVVRYEITKYNKAGKPDTIVTTDAFGKPQNQIVINYENNGKKQIKNYYSANGNLYQKEVTIFDGEYPISVETYNSEGALIICHRDIWKNGLRDSTVFFNENGVAVARLGFDYDSHGNIINQHGVDENGEPFRVDTYEYEYDNRGNWVRRVYRLDGKPYYMMERVIEYYPEDNK